MNAELPPAIYIAVGVLVLQNLGSLFGVFRVVWWAAKVDFRIGQLEKDLNNIGTMIKKQGVKNEIVI